jgi:hypothetical protein
LFEEVVTEVNRKNRLVVNREKMAARLTKLRESQLREEACDLKKKANYRQQIEQTLADASMAAREAAGSNLRDLGLFGEVRLGCIRLGKELARQILHHSERVMRAKKLAESACAAHRKIVQGRHAAEETLHERDAEQFFTWKRVHRG